MEAAYTKSLSEHRVKCLLCPHHCAIAPGERGKCFIRYNEGGKLFSEIDAELSAVNLDPIEKKPLYHFYPSSQIYSLGGLGCNFNCACCQNYHISQGGRADFPRVVEISSDEIISRASNIPGNIGIAYTYNEPTVWIEFMLEIAQKAKAHSLKNVMVSNGYVNTRPLKDLIQYIDAFNIDLKCFDNEKHKRFTGGELKHVLNSLKVIRNSQAHLELTHLVVPGISDDLNNFEKMISWIKKELGPEVPLHLSRYFPKYKFTEKATALTSISEMAELASKELHFVYLGNTSGNEFKDTYCPTCKELVIRREYFGTEKPGLAFHGKCRSCGHPVCVD